MEPELVPGESPPTPLGQTRIGAINVEKTNVAKLEQLVCLAASRGEKLLQNVPPPPEGTSNPQSNAAIGNGKAGNRFTPTWSDFFEPGAVSHLACI